MPDTPPNDPDRAARAAAIRAKLHAMMQALAVPEPLYAVEAEQEQRAPSRREPCRPALVTDPAPPDQWPA
jgi:hypothetical protein